MAGASVRQPITRPCLGRKTLRRCQNNVVTDNVVFIDVDGDDLENIIVIDSPELHFNKRGGSSGSKVKEHHQRVVICIDDEDSFDKKHPDTGVKKRCNSSSGASSSMGPSAADNHDQFQSDGTEFVQENISSPVTISKCKRTYSGKAPARNRYGLGPQSNNEFSNDESLDCDLVEEDSSGSVRQQWEKASSKRKYGSRNDQTGFVDCSKTPKSSKNVDPFKKVSQGKEESPSIVPCMRNDGPGEKAFSCAKTSSEEKLWPGRSDELLNANPSSNETSFLDHDFHICTDKVGTRHTRVSSHSTCDIDPPPQVNRHPVNETFSSNDVDEEVPLHEKSDHHFDSAESCMISDREKLKETDVYKKVIEEEWESRRRVLQIQAEEAKQLRRVKKRENAERRRLMDMERRQKQRVEEIRETNKKDEEQMNMKEIIRAEIRNKLYKEEISCQDMASLLRSLGIQVGSELKPSADEVRVACKKALFAFHPDRASKSNTREQVEAEEKFKLICRMKEKFSVA